MLSLQDDQVLQSRRALIAAIMLFLLGLSAWLTDVWGVRMQRLVVDMCFDYCRCFDATTVEL